MLASELDAEMIVADLADRDEVDRVIEEVRNVDALVSNAALPAGGAVESFTNDEIDRALEVNLRAPIVLSRHVTAAMAQRRYGHVVFVSSLAAAFPTPGLAIYNTTKTALVSYGLSLRAELAPHGVGVSVVCPGPIRDAGMWADTGLPAPMGMPTRSPADVGSAVVHAIEADRAEAIVATLPLRVSAFFGRSMPATVAKLAPRFGATALTGAMAEALKHKR